MDDSNLTNFFNEVVKSFNNLSWEINNKSIKSEINIKNCHVNSFIFISFVIESDRYALRIEYRSIDYDKTLNCIDIKNATGNQRVVFKSLSSWLSAIKLAFNNVVE
jgi:hypothetical protein